MIHFSLHLMVEPEQLDSITQLGQFMVSVECGNLKSWKRLAKVGKVPEM